MAVLVAQQVLVDLQGRARSEFKSPDELGQWLTMSVLQTFALFAGPVGAGGSAEPVPATGLRAALLFLPLAISGSRLGRFSVVAGATVFLAALAGATAVLLLGSGAFGSTSVIAPSQVIVAPPLGVPFAVPTPTVRPSAAAPTPRPTPVTPFRAKAPAATTAPQKRPVSPRPSPTPAVVKPATPVVPVSAVTPPKPKPPSPAVPPWRTTPPTPVIQFTPPPTSKPIPVVAVTPPRSLPARHRPPYAVSPGGPRGVVTIPRPSIPWSPPSGHHPRSGPPAPWCSPPTPPPPCGGPWGSPGSQGQSGSWSCG